MQSLPYSPCPWLLGWIDWFIHGLQSSGCPHFTLSHISNASDLKMNGIRASYFLPSDVVGVLWAHHEEAVGSPWGRLVNFILYCWVISLEPVTQEAGLLCGTTSGDHIKVPVKEWVFLVPSLDSNGGNRLLMHALMIKKFPRVLTV